MTLTLRALAAATLVNCVGNGLFMTVSALYFTQVMGLSPAQVGLGLGAAGLSGILAGIPLGRLADRWGSRRLLIVLLVLEGAAVLLYTQVSGFAPFVALVCLVTFLDRGSTAVRNTLVAASFAPEARVGGRAFIRAVINAGVGVGCALAALALQAGTRQAYELVVVADAATFLVAAVLMRKVPEPVRQAKEARGGRNALTDAPYLLVTALNAVLCVQIAVLEFGLPLWIVRATDAPPVMVAAVLVTNTVMCVLFQVRASRGITGVRKAARVCAGSAVLLAVACLLFSGAGSGGALAAVLLLLAGAVVQTTAELYSTAASWALSYDLADPASPGAYQGLFSTGQAAGILLGPSLVAATALQHGPAGWLILAALFVAAGTAMIPATRWATS
ncbi:MFS transporter [Nonomuraea sp. NPDC050556]|uniref:MFS transporter n=1 Tax=Nonomuraea sp. NPDC050556 TaxID=3364369 RepID=UPI0037A07CB7